MNPVPRSWENSYCGLLSRTPSTQKLLREVDFSSSVASIYAIMFHSDTILAHPTQHNMAFHDKSLLCRANCFKDFFFFFLYKRVLHLEFNITIKHVLLNLKLIHSVHLFLNDESILILYPG